MIIDYTASKKFLGKNKRLKLAWCDSSIKKETTTTTSVLDDLQIGSLDNEEKMKLRELLSYPEVTINKIGYTMTIKH